MATTLRLPMLFYIEDNGLGISVRGDMQTPGGDIARNLESFGNLFIRDGNGAELLRWLQPASERHRGDRGESRGDPETQRLARVDRHPNGAGGRYSREHGSERRVVVCGRHHDDRAREPRDRPDVREHV